MKDVVIATDTSVVYLADSLATSTHAAADFRNIGMGVVPATTPPPTVTSVSVPDLNLTVCPAGDADSLSFTVTIPHHCGVPEIGEWPEVAAVRTSHAQATLWERVSAEDPYGDELPYASYSPGEVADTARFVAKSISGCNSTSYGLLQFNVVSAGATIVTTPAIRVRSLDLSPPTLIPFSHRKSSGSVDRFDETQYTSINPGIGGNACNDFLQDSTINAQDRAIFDQHFVPRHHIPRRLVVPNGGESFGPGQQIDFEWMPGYGDSARVSLVLIRDGSTDTTMVSINSADDGAHSWSVPSYPVSKPTPGTSYRAHVIHTAGSWLPDGRHVGTDSSDATLTIRPAPGSNLWSEAGRIAGTLHWTEPGQVGGQADAYEIRRSTAPISEANWASATLVSYGVSPGPAGTTHCLEVPLATCSQHYVAIKTMDNGAWSLPSANFSVHTTCSGPSMYLCDEGGLWGGGEGGEESARELEASRSAGERSGSGSSAPAITEENSLLGETLGGEFVDLFRFASPIGVKGDAYRVRLRESGAKRARIDQLRLAVVDHAPEVVAIAGAGEVHLGVLAEAAGVSHASGDALELESSAYITRGGEVLLVDLGQSKGAAALVVESFRSATSAKQDSIGILVQRQQEDGRWFTIGRIQPRRLLDRTAIPSQGSRTLRLVALRDYVIRSISRLDVTETPAPSELPLLVVEHSEYGSVVEAVGQTGGSTTKLDPGDTLQVSFAASPVAPGASRDFFLFVKGSYEVLEDYRITQGRDSQFGTARVFEFSLGQARPNPSTGSVTIGYTLAQETRVAIRVYDVAGRMVRTLVNEMGSPGPHEIVWDATSDDGRRVAAGVYFYRMDAGAWQSRKKVVFLER